MPSQVHKRGPTKPEMVITPLIDVVFLLIVFFMLINNIIAEETVQMIVPRLDNAKTRELGEVDRIVVNIEPQPYHADDRRGNPLLFEGEAWAIKVSTTSFKPHEMEDVTAVLIEARQRNPQIEVLIRADGALYYDAVQPVMEAITQAGIDKVNLVAYMPDTTN